MKHVNCLPLVLASLCFSSEALSLDYFVNPNGNDSWSGTLKQPDSQSKNGPFQTLERAKQAIKTLKQNNAFNGPVTVHIAAGHYYLSQPLRFDLLDSGFPGREIVWEGDTAGEVVISGGIPVTCRKKDEKLWECPLKQLPVNKDFFNPGHIKGNAPKFEVFVNEQKLELARWPDQGWAHIKTPLDEKSQFSVIEPLPAFKGNINNAQVHIFPGSDWYDQYLGLDSLDPDNNAVKLSSQTAFPLISGRRFYVNNIMSALDAPGEWMYDEVNKNVLFIPQQGIAPQHVILSSLPDIVNMNGTSYVTFQNLTFQHGASSALTMTKVSNIVLNQLNVNNISGRGVVILDSQSVQFKNSSIFNTGGTALWVSGGDSINLAPAGHIISNNRIRDFSRVLLSYEPGILVLGVGTTIAHNLIEQGPTAGIVIRGNDHIIEKNELHHLCLQLSDCGAIYSGRNWAWRGNVIRHNYIHDIIGYGLESVDLINNVVKYRSPADARGIYLDDGASGFEINGNIVENVGYTAVCVGGGRDNKIVNNYLKTGEFAIMVDERWPTFDWTLNQKALDESPFKSTIWRNKYPELAASMRNYKWPEGNRIERNIVVSTKPGGLALQYFLPVESTIISSNLVWSTSGGISVDYKHLETGKRISASWAEWMAVKVEKDSIVADPCVTISNNKMTTCPFSPIKDIGFTLIPTDIGLIK